MSEPWPSSRNVEVVACKSRPKQETSATKVGSTRGTEKVWVIFSKQPLVRSCLVDRQDCHYVVHIEQVNKKFAIMPSLDYDSNASSRWHSNLVHPICVSRSPSLVMLATFG